ncbi:hypothetical protein ACH5RR_020771 [Cinchona calisaya]|uniref:F-box domain-containing protein n=1 Tax=Cinchona calisaya TaxID=153742 RepID=A0ABD2ZIE0_9GENT
MTKNFKISDGLPLVTLAGTGAAIAIGIGIKMTVTLVEKHRKHKDALGDKHEDRISLLSDDLLSDIMSRLNVIEAVRTRILSRRWRNIFLSNSRLHFDCNMFGSIQHNHKSRHCCQHKFKFIKAVDQCLKRFSGQSINYFGLKCCLGKEFAPNFNRWMKSIASFGVQELMVKFCSPSEFPFQLLFEVASLKHLQLASCTLQRSFKGQFKSLQFLYLDAVPLDKGEFTSILSSCMNLQGITVAHCKLPQKLSISGHCLQLRSVLIQSCSGVLEIEIRHGNLSAFCCYTDKMMRYSLPFAPKLDLLCINFNARYTLPYFFFEVAKGCAGLKKLLIQTKTDELKCTVFASMLSNLRVLYLLTVLNTKADPLNVGRILALCPLLEHFRLLARGRVGNEPRAAKSSAVAATEHHAHLKLIELEGFRGTRNDIELASYMLRSAPALERLSLFTSYTCFLPDFSWTEHKDYVMDNEQRQLIYKELEGQAISSKAKVVIS